MTSTFKIIRDHCTDVERPRHSTLRNVDLPPPRRPVPGVKPVLHNTERRLPLADGAASRARYVDRQDADRLALRNASNLDHRFPLGVVQFGKPVFGPNAFDYYKSKYARGEVGRYWLHHVAAYSGGERPGR